MRRLEPSEVESEEMFRGNSFNTNEQFTEILNKFRKGYSVKDGYPAESWTDAVSAARKYMGDARYQMLVRLPKGHPEARDVSALSRAFADEIAKGEVPQGKLARTDSEILMPRWAKFRVKKIGRVQNTREGKTVEIILEAAR